MIKAKHHVGGAHDGVDAGRVCAAGGRVRERVRYVAIGVINARVCVRP